MKYVDLLGLGKQKSESQTVDKKEVSTSMVNDDLGMCPKCQKSMSSAQITNGEMVYYCEGCRVALPMPNEA